MPRPRFLANLQSVILEDLLRSPFLSEQARRREEVLQRSMQKQSLAGERL